MTEAFVQVVRFIFGSVWRLCTSWHIPGTNISPAEWAILSLVVVRVIQIIRTIFGVYTDVQEDEKRNRKGG